MLNLRDLFVNVIIETNIKLLGWFFKFFWNIRWKLYSNLFAYIEDDHIILVSYTLKEEDSKHI